MPLSFLFWVVYVIVVMFGSWLNYEAGPVGFRRVGGHVATMVLIGLLGYGIFGPVIK